MAAEKIKITIIFHKMKLFHVFDKINVALVNRKKEKEIKFIYVYT